MTNTQTIKKAIITGGSRGIGRGIAMCLARCGYDVAVSYNEKVDEANELAQIIKKEYGRNCYVFQASLEKHGIAEEYVRKATEKLGGLNLLVNNAGLSIVYSIFDMTDETIDLLLNLNLRSYLMAAREAGRIMARNGTKGNIINISSIRGERAYPGDVVYGATKAAINRATEAFALDLAPYGIRVNSIAPGNTKIRTSDELRLEGADPEYIEDLDNSASLIPLERRGEPDDIGRAVAWLASEDASYITGITLRVDGGILLPGLYEGRYKDNEEYHRWGYVKKRTEW